MADVDWSSLSLYPATDEQIVEYKRRTFVQWGKGVLEEEYLQNDYDACEFEVATDGKLQHWVLVDRADPTSPTGFYCSCQTFRRTAVVFRKAAGKHENVTGYAVASVFTPLRYRKRGYARHMMRLLHWILAVPEQLPSNNFPVKWGLPPKIHPELGMGRGHFSTLWSDVGQFYETCGPFGDKKRSWMLRSPISTIWKVGCTGTELSQGNWRWLNHEEIGRLWDRDESAMQQEQAAMASVTTRPILLTYLPGNGTESFQRLDILPYTRNIVPPMDTWGVALDMDLPSTAFATWTVEVKPTSLTVTRLRASPSQFETIVARLLEVAERHGMTKVEIWNLPEELRGVSAQTGGVTGARQGHLPYICSYWPEDSDEIEWCFNERFCWC